MFKFLSFLVIVGVIFSLCSPSKSINQNRNSREKDKTPLDLYLRTFSDSIEAIGQSMNFPRFLDDPQFDYDHIRLASPSHHPMPLRKMLIDKVNNCESLQRILKNPSPRIKEIPILEDDIQVKFQELSFFELIKLRYEALHCK